MADDRQLLRQFAADHSESAFGELVTRHLPLVYSIAVRQANGDAHLAKDIAQLVFTDLARKVRALSGDIVLAGWLHRATIFAARQVLRGERRRHLREQQAATMNAIQSETENGDWRRIRPLLDDALEHLNQTDRDALLLRFFEQRSLADVGAHLGGTEDAARKRIARALEKLRTNLQRRGVTTTAALLTTVISANAIQAPPAGLAATLANASFTAAGTGKTLTLLKIMTATQLKLGLGALVAAVVVAALVIEHQTRAHSRIVSNRQMAMSKMDDAKNLAIDFLMYAHDNQGQFPASFEQINPYIQRYPVSQINDFKIVYQGSSRGITNPKNVILIKESQAWPVDNGKWGKTYAFADGHAEIHVTPNGNFDAFEQQHSVSPRASQ